MDLEKNELDMCLFAIDFFEKYHSSFLPQKDYEKIRCYFKTAKDALSSKSNTIHKNEVAAIHLSLSSLQAIANDEIDCSVDIFEKHKILYNIDMIDYLIDLFQCFLNQRK